MAASFPSAVKSFSTKTDGAGQTIFAAHVNDIQDEVVALEQDLVNGLSRLRLSSSALTLSSDTVTATKSLHTVDTEGAAASDNLATITAGTGVGAGHCLILYAANAARVVTVKDSTGNITLAGGDFALDSAKKSILLRYDGSNWVEIARASTLAVPVTVANGGTGVATLTNHGVVLGQGTSAVAITTAGTAGHVLTSNGAAADPTFQAGLMSLLKANSGTDTNAGATNVDTIAITGLTVKDTLHVFVFASEATQAVARLDLRNETDTTQIVRLTAGGAVNAGVTLATQTIVSSDQSSSTVIDSYVAGATTGGTVSEAASVAVATAWTGAWTLSLRHGGVTAGGTLRWKWAVYKVAGQ